MANFHSRSNSLPSECIPVMNEIQDQLCQLKGSEATSTTGKSTSSNLAGLVSLHKSLKNLIQTPSFQQALWHDQCGSWIDEVLEGSLALIDLCGFSRDVASISKESIRDLKSSIRRNRGQTATSDDINSYVASRKKIYKMVNNKCVMNSKRCKQNSTTLVQEDVDLKTMVIVFREIEAISSSVLNSVLSLLSGSKARSKHRNWSLLSKFTQTSRIYSEADQECSYNDLFNEHFYEPIKGIDNATLQNIMKKLKGSEMAIHELEEGLEALFRSLVKTRVSLLNVLSDH
ncbi:uncharacterized protein LOC142533653 [Primulina tabacum]|uniref:uncharacterized protein LOC142533653 n=1 Tax=Primulina tabacum TaxID=48773 RepID=UPI003F5A2222